MSYDIHHNAAIGRFETTVEGHVCIIDYRCEGNAVYLTHVGVPPPVENRGIAGSLTQAALEWARDEDLQVVPICPYVVAWIRRHPEYRPLLSPR
jgi:predicted GNAT family acetyltransferase